MKLFACLSLLALLTTPSIAAKLQLPGEVTYRERVALPEGAVLSIELIDLALPDRPRISVSAPTGAGQVPLAFSLTFEQSLILPQHNYALNAEIRAGDFLFRNAEPFPVTPLAQIEPVVIVTSPVTQEDLPPNEPATDPADLPIINVTWWATSIGEVPVPPGIDISLLVEPSLRAGGVGGCNSYFSQAQIAADSFLVADVARTMRSCLYERNMLEKRYFEALKAARMWIVDKGTLSLLDSAGKPVVTFTR